MAVRFIRRVDSNIKAESSQTSTRREPLFRSARSGRFVRARSFELPRRIRWVSSALATVDERSVYERVSLAARARFRAAVSDSLSRGLARAVQSVGRPSQSWELTTCSRYARKNRDASRECPSGEGITKFPLILLMLIRRRTKTLRKL